MAKRIVGRNHCWICGGDKAHEVGAFCDLRLRDREDDILTIFELCICQGCYYKYTYTKEEIIKKGYYQGDRYSDKCIEDKIDHCLKLYEDHPGSYGEKIKIPELFIYLIFKKLESFNYDFNPKKYPFERFVDMIKEIDFKCGALSRRDDGLLLSSYGFNPEKMCDEEKALILNR